MLASICCLLFLLIGRSNEGDSARCDQHPKSSISKFTANMESVVAKSRRVDKKDRKNKNLTTAKKNGFKKDTFNIDLLL